MSLRLPILSTYSEHCIPPGKVSWVLVGGALSTSIPFSAFSPSLTVYISLGHHSTLRRAVGLSHKQRVCVLWGGMLVVSTEAEP